MMMMTLLGQTSIDIETEHTTQVGFINLFLVFVVVGIVDVVLLFDCLSDLNFSSPKTCTRSILKESCMHYFYG
jgi:hypothetical protein